MFNSETPINIMDYDVDDVWKLVKDDPSCKFPNPRVRLNYIKMLYDVLGLTLTPDVALASIAMPRAILCISPAGGGKTTWAQVISIMYKLLYPNPKRPERKVAGKKILCLVYNKHNVADMERRHSQLIARLKIANIKGLHIDDEINACTMHSFCDFIRKQYVARLNMVGFTLIDGADSVNMMSRSIIIAYKKLKVTPKPDINPQNLLNFYNLCRECMLPPSAMEQSDKFEDLGMGTEEIEAVFAQYETAKRIGRRYDYVDMIANVSELLQSDQKALADVQKYFDVVIADEVQDFTPIMWKLLQLFVSNGTPLTCIGDEDQCIYHFRGASMEDLLHFPERFDGGRVYSLLINRRCRKKILDEANAIIQENTQRFNKKLIGTKDGGSIEMIPYNTMHGQLMNLVSRLKAMSTDDQQKTVCCFREQKCSQLLIDMLEEEGITFHSVQNMRPFRHELYSHVIGVLNALELPYSREVSLNLYKVLPCSRKQINDVFMYSFEKKKFLKDDPKMHFAKYDYGNIMGTKGFSDVMLELIKISNEIKTAPMSSYIGKIFEFLDKYFWKYKKEQNNDSIYDEAFDERVRRFFNYDGTYPEFFEAYHKRIHVCASNNEGKYGVALSTFHGLKGLEFNHVFVIFMDDEIFPNYSLIESKQYDSTVERSLKESETRLWYVTVTRAIDDLHVYYSLSNPSKYVQDYLDRLDAGGAIQTESGSSGMIQIPESPVDEAAGGFSVLSGEGSIEEDPRNGSNDDFSDDFCDNFCEDEPETFGAIESCSSICESLMEQPEGPKEEEQHESVVEHEEISLHAVEKTKYSSTSQNDFLTKLIANL